VTLHVHTCSGRNRIIFLMRRPNTDSTPKKKARNVTAQPTYDTLRGNEPRAHRHDTVLRYAVTLQVWTHPKKPHHTTKRKTFNTSFGNKSALPYGSDLYIQPEYPEGLHPFTIVTLRTILHYYPTDTCIFQVITSRFSHWNFVPISTCPLATCYSSPIWLRMSQYMMTAKNISL